MFCFRNLSLLHKNNVCFNAFLPQLAFNLNETSFVCDVRWGFYFSHREPLVPAYLLNSLPLPIIHSGSAIKFKFPYTNGDLRNSSLCKIQL